MGQKSTNESSGRENEDVRQYKVNGAERRSLKIYSRKKLGWTLKKENVQETATMWFERQTENRQWNDSVNAPERLRAILG